MESKLQLYAFGICNLVFNDSPLVRMTGFQGLKIPFGQCRPMTDGIFDQKRCLRPLIAASRVLLQKVAGPGSILRQPPVQSLH